MDKDLFYNLYYGNYQANDQVFDSTEYNELNAKISSITHQLSAIVGDSNRELLDELQCAYSSLCSFYSSESYISGIKFATNFLFNALCDNNFEKK